MNRRDFNHSSCFVNYMNENKHEAWRIDFLNLTLTTDSFLFGYS